MHFGEVFETSPSYTKKNCKFLIQCQLKKGKIYAIMTWNFRYKPTNMGGRFYGLPKIIHYQRSVQGRYFFGGNSYENAV